MEFNGMRVLVTGGAGFLGSHFTRALLARGASVALLVQPHDSTWRLEGLESGIERYRISLLDRSAVNEAVRSIRPSVMVHFAGRMERRRDVSILDDLTDRHVRATMNLFTAADPTVTRLIVNTGTSEEYGEQPDPFVETMPTDPVSPYSATKAAATAITTYLSRQLGVPAVTMRPFIVFGPGQLHDTLIPFLIRRVLERKPADLTEGLQYRDFLFVDDLVDCYLAALERADRFYGPEIINVGSGRKTQVRQVIEIIADLRGGRDYLKIGARPMRSGEPLSMVADIGKAERLLGWTPRVSLQEGLRRTVDWWKENESLWRDRL